MPVLRKFDNQTRAGLEFALEEHKTINANIDIQAPILIIPESITQESTLCMILDAGPRQLEQRAGRQEINARDSRKAEPTVYRRRLSSTGRTDV